MQITPEQALFLRDAALPSLETEHRLTANVLKAVPAAQADYRPDANSMSAFDLAWHIAISEARLLGFVVKGEYGSTPPPEKATSLDGVVNFYSESFKQNLAELKAMTGEQLAKVLDFRGLFKMPAVMFINFEMSHEIHHRGQLSVYLRPMGAKVPSMYGESYDDKQSRLAATAS
jgi:uncharacterized damage-inducible protein DinB